MSPHTIPELLAEIRALLADRAARPRTILCANAHIANLAAADSVLRGRLECARIVAADGMALVWAGRWLGAPLRARCNMTEAFRAFLAADMPASRAALLGGEPDTAAAAAQRVAECCPHCRIVATQDGYRSEDEYRAFLEAAGPLDFVLIGMGTPRSEAVCELAAAIRPEAVVWHIGGGTLLFLAGAVREAPAWMRRSGLQWLHRLLAEPRRMWRRYVLGNPRFIARVLRQKWGQTLSRP